ncbi:MAG: methyltransferase domain-containing protein [Fischerella sp.]|jgi:ubiquinone/menaquinone biosynthesis C-methylase UbiE|uniref:class I SAM-dependent methyltransferase n=1 Tax=Fischerella sp. TaxID=1191 RepID=UPI0017EF84A7|nr:class I SAM-dependent methyltransferase [Fischerella sp.]NWF59122.1 methyltransferase domain-containing protein [Fischerella sp.]
MENMDKRVQKEVEFHDRWAATIDVVALDVDIYFEGSTSPENRFIMRQLGDIQGKRILDLGCGAGENSVYFARKGAHCIASDISSGMVETALKLADKYGVKVDGKVINAMNIDFPDNSFDIVYAANILHHVNPKLALQEMYRVVKPGGKVCFWEPLKHNPIINIYRQIAKDVRTEDEAPLDINIIQFTKKLFSDVKFDTFWLISLWIFIQFYLIERVSPNKERYWKKIIYEEPRLRRLYFRLERLDYLVKKLPFMKRFAWNIAVVATK